MPVEGDLDYLYFNREDAWWQWILTVHIFMAFSDRSSPPPPPPRPPHAPFTVERGMRIAQAVLAPVVRIAWQEVGDLDPTARGTGGFGSTGTATG